MLSAAVRWSLLSWCFLLAATVAVPAGPLAVQPERSSHQGRLSTSSLPLLFIQSSQEALFVRTPELSARFQAGNVDFDWREGHVVLSFPGSVPGVSPEGLDSAGGKANLLLGDDPKRWRRDLPVYGGVAYRGLYPGIDMFYGGTGRRVKSEFLVAPGADPGLIRMRYCGAGRPTIDSDGSLLIPAGHGVMREEAPTLYQESAGHRVSIHGRFRVTEEGDLGFAVGRYDPRLPLWIDPTISYSTFLGGSRNEYPMSIAVDATGNTYIAGWTDSPNFPLASPIRTYAGSVDAFVAKFNASGSSLAYATYVGGSGEDRALGIDIDPSGNAYVVGYTTSSNFPTAAPIQSARAGGRDAFIFKLNPAGSALVYSTYYGGGGNDQANGVAVDPYGQPYVVGETDSTNFPTRFPFQSALRGRRDAFTFKIGLSGALSYSTYVGGSGDDRGTAIALSSALTPYIVGCTESSDFPTRNAAQPVLSGSQDAYVVRFNSDANFQVYSTYLGGSGGSGGGIGQTECAYAIAVDAYSNAYVTGVTPSTNFPVLNAFQSVYGGGSADAFVAKIDSGGVRLYSSYLGGRNVDSATGIRVDSNRKAYITGYTSSNNFPVVAPVQATLGGLYDGFVTQVDVNGNLLLFSTYLGGVASDTPAGIALGSVGDLYVTGVTGSGNFPLVTPFQPMLGSSLDGFVTKLTGF